MWFISCLEYVNIFAKHCSSLTSSDLNSKSFPFTPTSGTKLRTTTNNFALYSRDAGTAVGQGAVKELRSMKIKKNKKNLY